MGRAAVRIAECVKLYFFYRSGENGVNGPQHRLYSSITAANYERYPACGERPWAFGEHDSQTRLEDFRTRCGPNRKYSNNLTLEHFAAHLYLYL